VPNTIPAVNAQAMAAAASARENRRVSTAFHAWTSAVMTRRRASPTSNATPTSAIMAGRTHECERTRMPAIRTLKPPVHQTAAAKMAAAAVTASSQAIRRSRLRSIGPTIRPCAP
jgi:hypothetical protein